MKWKLSFEVLGKTYISKKKNFKSFNEIDSYVKKFSENYIYTKKKKIKAIIESTNDLRYYEYFFHPDGGFEFYAKDLINKINPENLEKLCRTTNRPKDFQRKRLYDWEEKVFSKYGFFESNLGYEEVKNFIKKIIINENLPPLKVILKKGSGSCFFEYSLDGSVRPSLTFRKKWGLNRFVICHELAHYVCHVKNINEGGHSENFVGIYIYLLSKYGGLKEEQLWRSANNNKVKLTKYSKNHFKQLID